MRVLKSAVKAYLERVNAVVNLFADFGAIATVRELSTMSDAVSWTDKPVSYYLHAIDRKLVSQGPSTLAVSAVISVVCIMLE